MWSNCLFVALGGGLGAVGRYLLSLIAAPWSFPVMTLLTNFLGAVVIGAVAQAAGQLPMSKSAVLFLKTGLCGGFTTFSTFSLETVELLEQGRWAAGGGYILASWVCAWRGCCWGGPWCGRSFEDGDPHLRAAPLSK